jgi:hypothetical protein
MLLRLSDFDTPMKLVYQLVDDLNVDTERVALTQALTLDESKPLIGLKGKNGLFGSQEWWDNIYQGKTPLLSISGIATRVYCAGQDRSGVNNMVDIVEIDGSAKSIGIYVNDEDDAKLFRVGSKVAIVYALDELKQQPARDGSVNYSKVALEMAVSVVS